MKILLSLLVLFTLISLAASSSGMRKRDKKIRFTDTPAAENIERETTVIESRPCAKRQKRQKVSPSSDTSLGSVISTTTDRSLSSSPQNAYNLLNFIELDDEALFTSQTSDFDGFVGEEFRDDLIWDVNAEEEGTLSLSSSSFEFPEFNTITSDKDKSLSSNVKFSFDLNWPESDQSPQSKSKSKSKSPVPVKLPPDFRAFTFKCLTSPGNLESLKTLLTAGLVDLKRPIYDVERDILFSFLLAAVEWQGVEDDKRLLFISHSPKLLLNEPSSVGTLPLTAAIRCDRLDLVSKLVEAGADVNLVFQEYGTISTPFMTAIQSKRNNIVAFLLSTDKVDPNLVLPDGSNALTLLVTYQPTEISKWFPKLVDGQRKMTGEFFFCVLHPFFITKNFMLKNIIDSVVREQLNWLLTPVTAMAYIATRENDLNMLRFLNDIGSKFNSYRSKQGFGLIHVAAWEGFTEIVEFLIQTGADVNLLVGNDAKTSAIQLAFSGGHFDLVCKLIRLGATAGLPGVIQAAITTDNRQIISALS